MNWECGALSGGGLDADGDDDDIPDLVTRAEHEMAPLSFGAERDAPTPLAFDLAGFPATIGAQGRWELDDDALITMRSELDARRLEVARLSEELALERDKADQLSAALAASQIDESRARAEAERERRRAQLYYSELQRCYELLCERGIPVPS